MEEKNELGLTTFHENGLESYLKFCRRQRGERLRSINACFKDVMVTRIVDETYTSEEVEEMMDNLASIVENEVETELLHDAHSNSVLVTSLFAQAQKWHLQLIIDTAQLENQEKLASIRKFEVTGPSESLSSLKKSNQLAPLEGDKGGPHSLLEAHIEKLEQQNLQFIHSVKELESKVISLTLDKENLQLDESASQKEISHLKKSLGSKPKDEDVSQMSDEITEMKLNLNEAKVKSEEEKLKIAGNLSATEESFRKIQSQLRLAEKELDSKFSRTGAYQNMKKMLSKKNSQLSELRKKLASYEPQEEDEECRVDDDE